MAAILPGYRPTFAQQKIHASKTRIKALTGGIRSGKTLSGAADFVSRILDDHDAGKGHHLYQPGPWHKRMRPLLLYWTVAPNYALLKESITYTLDAFPQHMRFMWLENEHTAWITLPRGYVEIGFKSAELPEKTLISRAINGAFVDEAARCPPETWPLLRGRLTDFKGWATMATSPIGGRGNPFYRDILASEDPEIERFELRTIDNPIIDLAEVRRAKAQMPERFFKRDYLCDWSSWGNAVYPEWDPAVHRISEKRLLMELGAPQARSLTDIKRQFRSVTIGVDFGYSAPAAMVVLVQLMNGDFVVAEEFYEAGLLVSSPDPNMRTLLQEAWRLQRKWSPDEQRKPKFMVDTEDAQARAQFTYGGLSVWGANKDRIHGVRKTATLLHVNTQSKRPRLRILDTCKNTCDTLGRLSWALDKNGDPIEGEWGSGVPLHAADALRYAAVEVTRDDDDGIKKVATVQQQVGFGTWIGYRRV